MDVLIPEIEKDGSVAIWRPMKNEEHMISKYKSGLKDKMLCLKNKEAVWNNALNSYVLSFLGRVTKSSIKNFQLVTSTDSFFRV